MSDRLASGATNNARADFLLELLSEEIPARMQAKARNDLARMMAEALASAGLSHDGITTYSTPRRLALIAKGLPAATEAVSEEIKGPKTTAPQQALDGFLRKTGLTQDQLQDRDGTWFAVIDKASRATTDVLAEAVATMVRDFQWPKSMRWGAASASTASLRWVRPLHSIVALLGEAIVPVDIEGVTCGAATLGHRFHHPGPITIGGAHDYVEKLRACHVLVDQAEREAIVRKGGLEAAAKAGFVLVEDEGLVVENAGLTEWPVPLLGSFDADYLDVPPEVIQLTARTNQKYFVMRDGAGKLAPHFVCTANIDANDGGAAIIAGNERVLAARLSDARFFWQQDLKVPLEEQAKKLDRVLLHEKLGPYSHKVFRVAHLAKWLADEKKIGGIDPIEIDKAARLAKSDLVSSMVGEFPELQGIIGGHLASRQGLSIAISTAIREQYLPSSQSDPLPSDPNSVALSLADKLETLVSYFAVGEMPTGSRDPFALRRAALTAISLILANNIRINLRTDLVHTLHRVGALQLYLVKIAAEEKLTQGLEAIAPKDSDIQKMASDQFFASLDRGPVLDAGAKILHDGALGLNKLIDFFADRLKVQQREAGVRHDLIDAVFALGGEDDLVRLLARVKALQAFVETGEGANLLIGYKRAANILKKEEGSWTPDQVRGDGDLAVDEAALAAALDAAGPTATAAVEAEDFTAAMSALASLRAPIDAFFDKVIVNDPDAGVRARRLNLLARFRDAVHAVADFSKIEG